MVEKRGIWRSGALAGALRPTTGCADRGTRLDPVPEAYVAPWFAWAAFHPDTDLREAS